MKKIVIIGGGIAGLSAGVYAQKSGFESVILEKHTIVGGQCTGWKRQGAVIDNCIHWLTGTKEGTKLYRLWEDIGMIGSGLEVIKPQVFFKTEHEGESITLWRNKERTRAEMLALSPADKGMIDDLFDAVNRCETLQVPVEKPFALMNPLDYMKLGSQMAPMGPVMKSMKKITLAEYATRFKHPVLRRMFSDYVPSAYCAYTFAVSYATFTSGNGDIPAGGSLAAALRIQKRYESFGGVVRTGAEVTAINVKTKRVTGVTLADGSFLEADYVICSSDPQCVFGTMLDNSYMDKKLAAAYRDYDANPAFSGFSAAYVVDGDCADIEGTVAFDCAPLFAGTRQIERLSIRAYNYDPALMSGGKTVIQTQLVQHKNDYEAWQKIAADKEAYAAEKKRLAADIQNRIETRFHQYRGRLTLVDTWSPLTYTRYLGSWYGAYMSFAPTPLSKNSSFTGTVRGLDNLFLAGQWLMPPGGLPSAAATGKFAMQHLLKKEGRCINL